MFKFVGLLLAFLAGAAAMVAVVLFGPDFLDSKDDGGKVEVVVREGEAELGDDGDALVVLSKSHLEQLVLEALEDANLEEFDLDDLEAELIENGIEISGEVDIRVQGVPLSPRFTAVVHPIASEGSIAVEVGEVRAAGARLPSIFERGVEGVINEELAGAVEIDGYSIGEVELGDQELLIYLVADEA